MTDYSYEQQNIFFRFLDCKYDFGLQPISIGFERCTESKEKIGPRAKSHFILHYVLNGQGYYKIGSETHTVGSNTIFLIPPEIMTTYAPNPADPWQYLWVEFNGFNVKPLVDSAFAPKEYVYRPTEFEKIRDEFSQMVDDCINWATDSSLKTVSHLLAIFHQLILEHRQPEETHYDTDIYKVQSIVNYINNNLHDYNMTVKEISRKFFFNEAYLSRLFKKVMGMPPVRYIIEQRMQKACQMLNSKSFSITAISEAVGYKDPFYFSKEFKRLMKCTPTQYVNQLPT